jgi:hypothetical protein
VFTAQEKPSLHTTPVDAPKTTGYTGAPHRCNRCHSVLTQFKSVQTRSKLHQCLHSLPFGASGASRVCGPACSVSLNSSTGPAYHSFRPFAFTSPPARRCPFVWSAAPQRRRAPPLRCRTTAHPPPLHRAPRSRCPSIAAAPQPTRAATAALLRPPSPSMLRAGSAQAPQA